LLLSLIQAKVVKSARNEPGYDSSNDADDNAINNIFDRSSMKKKQGRRYSFDDQQSEYEKKKMEARMEKSEKNQSVLVSNVAKIGNLLEKAFTSNQDSTATSENPDSEVNSLMKKLEVAMETKTKFMNSQALPTNHQDIILKTLDYNINKAAEEIKEYWAKRDANMNNE
jgi:hypothetical protein